MSASPDQLKDQESHLDADARRTHQIAETAYFIAEQRGFSGHKEQTLTDWFKAEEIVDKISKK